MTRQQNDTLPSVEAQVRRSLSRHLMAGTALIAVLVLGAGGWAVTANVAGAVIARGSIVVDSHVQKVQHVAGGVVGELLARDGDKVEAGDVLVRLDSTLTRANLAVVAREMEALSARKARLQAERDGAASIQVPPALAARLDEPNVRNIVDSEQHQFDMRRIARDGQKAQLGERIAQIEQEIEGNLAQQRANAQELTLAQNELDGARDLWKRKLIAVARYTELERQVPQLEAVRGQLLAASARARGQMAEIRLQILQIDRDLGTEVGEALRIAEDRIGELTERRVAAEDQLRRDDIRAPQSGTVHQSTVHTIGGVIQGDGTPIMLIVPENGDLTVEARVRPLDIDQIHVGAEAILRLSAFNRRTTPEMFGTVSRISADTSHDPRTGETYYTIRVAIPTAEIGRLDDLRLMPGMPVEAFVQTGDRSVMSYLVKPAADQIQRAFRDE